MKWFLTEPPHGHVEMYAVTIEPGGSTGPRQYRHGDFEEVILVTGGAVRVELEDEVYDLSTALELDWYEHVGLCAPGEAEGLLRDGVTTIGGRVPVNPSGGLACFGEAVPAQAIAQICELSWQLRGEAEGRQVEGAKVGLAVNQGLFGHGSATILAR